MHEPYGLVQLCSDCYKNKVVLFIACDECADMSE